MKICNKTKIIVIVGPTGVGKTKLSIELSKIFDAEIINADSMQVYKDLNIGTAKIQEEEKEGIVHHLFDIKDVFENYTVFDYQKDAREVLNNLINKNKNVVIVGGTGLYIKALLYDYTFNEETFYVNYDNMSNSEIYENIKIKDPDVEVDINNRRRLERTLNRLTNSSNKTEYKGDNLLYENVTFIGITTDRELLYKRINERVDKMISMGLIDEVKRFYDIKLYSKAIITGIGYKELYQYFDGLITKEQAIDLIKKNSRKYAKRQYTWFNNKMNITWFNVDFNDFNNTIEIIAKFIEGV